MGWWQDAGAQVVTCSGSGDYYDCDCNDIEYGPHRRLQRDPTGHHATQAIVATPEHPRGWAVTTCECGWRNFPTLYREHLDAVAPLIEVYS